MLSHINGDIMNGDTKKTGWGHNETSWGHNETGVGTQCYRGHNVTRPIESSRRDLLNDVVDHRSIFKNNHNA